MFCKQRESSFTLEKWDSSRRGYISGSSPEGTVRTIASVFWRFAKTTSARWRSIFALSTNLALVVNQQPCHCVDDDLVSVNESCSSSANSQSSLDVAYSSFKAALGTLSEGSRVYDREYLLQTSQEPGYGESVSLSFMPRMSTYSGTRGVGAETCQR